MYDIPPKLFLLGENDKAEDLSEKWLYMTQRIFFSVLCSIVNAILKVHHVFRMFQIKSVLPSKEYNILNAVFSIYIHRILPSG